LRGNPRREAAGGGEIKAKGRRRNKKGRGRRRRWAAGPRTVPACGASFGASNRRCKGGPCILISKHVLLFSRFFFVEILVYLLFLTSSVIYVQTAHEPNSNPAENNQGETNQPKL
jgi:hypothetical protein